MRIISKFTADSGSWLLSAEAGLLPQAAIDLLTTCDSLTLKLENLNQDELTVDIKDVFDSRIDSAAAARLGIPVNSNALTREVFLKASHNRLVFAQTIFPITDATSEITTALAKNSAPLGKTLLAAHAKFTKEDLRIIGIDDAKTIDLIGYFNARFLYGRTYRLLITHPLSGAPIKALVTEVFSPELIGINYKKNAL